MPSKLFLTSKVYSVCEDDLNASSSGHVESCEDQSTEAQGVSLWVSSIPVESENGAVIRFSVYGSCCFRCLTKTKLPYTQMLDPWLLCLADVTCKAHNFCRYSGQGKLGSETNI